MPEKVPVILDTTDVESDNQVSELVITGDGYLHVPGSTLHCKC